MKNVLPIMICLLGISSASAQIEVKGFLEGSYFQYENLEEEDTLYFFTKRNGLQVKPSLAISFARIDRAFHEVAISNISIDNSLDHTNNPLVTSTQRTYHSTNLNFRYSYNFLILKEPKRWLPYIGMQSNHQLTRQNNENNTLQIRSAAIVSQVGLVGGTQFKLKDKFCLELQIPINLGHFSYRHRNLVNSQSPNGVVQQTINMNWNRAIFASIPIRVGVTMRI